MYLVSKKNVQPSDFQVVPRIKEGMTVDGKYYVDVPCSAGNVLAVHSADFVFAARISATMVRVRSDVRQAITCYELTNTSTGLWVPTLCSVHTHGSADASVSAKAAFVFDVASVIGEVIGGPVPSPVFTVALSTRCTSSAVEVRQQSYVDTILPPQQQPSRHGSLMLAGRVMDVSGV